jgi:hypothetical protein
MECLFRAFDVVLRGERQSLRAGCVTRRGRHEWQSSRLGAVTIRSLANGDAQPALRTPIGRSSYLKASSHMLVFGFPGRAELEFVARAKLDRGNEPLVESVREFR